MSSSKSPEEYRKYSVCFLLFAAVIFLLYFPAIHFPFLQNWDDGTFILFNRKLVFTLENFRYYLLEPFQDLYTPLPMISFMIDRALFGLDPLGFHLHNLLLHFIACCFLFLIVRRLGVRIWIAFAVALLWAANPQKVESVVWITERKDVLCGAFAFASIYCFLRSVAAGRIPALAGILSVLALLAKPAALPLPGVMIVGLICLYGRKMPVREYVRLLWFPVAATLAAAAWSAGITAKTNPGVPETNLLVPLHNLFWYPLTALVPYSLNPIYPTLRSIGNVLPPMVAGAVLAAAYVKAAGFLRFSRRQVICVLLVIAGCTVPVLGLLRYTDFHYCDRYNYLVSAAVWIGVALLLNAAVRRFRKAARPLKLLCLVIGVVYLFQTWNYLPYWENADMLYACSLAQDRLVNAKVLGNAVNAAFATENAGLLEEATGRLIEFYREYGFSESLTRNTVLFCQAHIALLQGRIPEALAHDRELRSIMERSDGQAIFLWPEMTMPLFYRDLALMAVIEKQPEQAIAFLERELEVRKLEDVQYYLARAMKAQLGGDRAALIAAWETVVKMEPQNLQYRKHLENLRREVSIP